jgi:hypothetical protein
MELTNIFPILQIISTIVSPLLTAIAILLWSKIKDMKTAIRDLSQDLDDVKYNYLDRFDDLKGVIAKMELNIIQRISILETRLAHK